MTRAVTQPESSQVVHRRLEREIRPPQVRIDIETPEEYWATRYGSVVSRGCTDSLNPISTAG